MRQKIKTAQLALEQILGLVVGVWCFLPAAAAPMIDLNTDMYGTQGDTLRFSIADMLSYDSNLFRLPSGVDPLPLIGKSITYDTINTFQVDLGIKKSYGLQSFILDGTLSQLHYQNFSYLNSHTTDYNGAWNWRVTPKLSGSLAAYQTQSPIDFAMIRSPTNTILTQQGSHFNGDWWIGGPWHGLFGVAKYNSDYSTIVYVQQNVHQKSGEIGAEYMSESRNSISLKTRYIQGEYSGPPYDDATLIDNGFSEHDEELKGYWQFGGKSILSGTMKYLALEHNHFSQRNYSGIAGNVDYQWEPTGKTLLKFSAQRSFEQYLTSYSSYYINDELSVSPVWQIEPRINLYAVFDLSELNYYGAVVPGTGPDRRDKTLSELIGVNWELKRSIAFAASLQHAGRESNYPYQQYNDTMLNVSAQYTFW